METRVRTPLGLPEISSWSDPVLCFVVPVAHSILSIQVTVVPLSRWTRRAKKSLMTLAVRISLSPSTKSGDKFGGEVLNEPRRIREVSRAEFSSWYENLHKSLLA